MADWATDAAMVAEEVLGISPDTFIAHYRANQSDLQRAAIGGNLFISTVVDVVRERKVDWIGTATELLDEANERLRQRDVRPSKFDYWPSAPQRVGQMLKEYASNLEAVGIKFDGDEVIRHGTRGLHFRHAEVAVVTEETASPVQEDWFE